MINYGDNDQYDDDDIDIDAILSEWTVEPFFQQYKDCRAYVDLPDRRQTRYVIRLKSEHGDIVIMEGVHTRDLADFIVEMINARLALTTPT